jgi:hypothetical protein
LTKFTTDGVCYVAVIFHHYWLDFNMYIIGLKLLINLSPIPFSKQHCRMVPWGTHVWRGEMKQKEGFHPS